MQTHKLHFKKIFELKHSCNKHIRIPKVSFLICRCKQLLTSKPWELNFSFLQLQLSHLKNCVRFTPSSIFKSMGHGQNLLSPHFVTVILSKAFRKPRVWWIVWFSNKDIHDSRSCRPSSVLKTFALKNL